MDVLNKRKPEAYICEMAFSRPTLTPSLRERRDVLYMPCPLPRTRLPWCTVASCTSIAEEDAHSNNAIHPYCCCVLIPVDLLALSSCWSVQMPASTWSCRCISIWQQENRTYSHTVNILSDRESLCSLKGRRCSHAFRCLLRHTRVVVSAPWEQEYRTNARIVNISSDQTTKETIDLWNALDFLAHSQVSRAYLWTRSPK